MQTVVRQIGEMVQAFRNDKRITQSGLAEALVPSVSRTAIALLEQGRRLPEPEVLERICRFLSIPAHYWQRFLDKNYLKVAEFEDVLSELVGLPLTLENLDDQARSAAENEILQLLDRDLTPEQTYDALRSVLVYYGVPAPTWQFFERHFDGNTFRTDESFRRAVIRYQLNAIRLFSTFSEAYQQLGCSGYLESLLAALQPRGVDAFRERTEWTRIETIPEERLADLGYIAAERVRKETVERTSLSTFLKDLADSIRADGPAVLDRTSDKRRRKMDSLLRKFDPGSRHSLFSPLFLPDPDQLNRKADQIAPKAEADLEKMAETQRVALQNLANYLVADYLDIYVATSMRTDADFVSVNRFVTTLFSHPDVRPLKLRYFNPTQSWIDDRVAKGLVEALMLRRAAITIYMAQKEDTFGKDSEASVSLGQGKPVIVYVPKLLIPQVRVDTEVLGRASRVEIEQLLRAEGERDNEEYDETVDNEALLGRLLTILLRKVDDPALAHAVQRHWADFDLYGEDVRIELPVDRAAYRAWLDDIIKSGKVVAPTPVLREKVISILVATALRFERRARVFREVHPLALQVILSSGVLNGILVSRSIESCANLINSLIRNDLQFELVDDDVNYRLVETTTGSTVRVISQHNLLRNAFSTFYETPPRHLDGN